MASRQSRKSTTTTVTESTSGETPRAGVSPGRRARSPSPARITRMQEKEQLQNLNDRLAAYIDRVRYLETENSRLLVQVRSSEETVTREVTNIKSLYESELGEARKLLDDTAKEKAKLQLDASKYKTEADDWQAKFNRRDRDAKNADKKNLELQTELGDLQAKLNDAENNRKYAEGEAARLRGEVASLERQLKELKKQLEEETLKRVDLENRIQSLKEELAFKSQVYEQELNETRTRTTTQYDEIDQGIREDYDSKLADALQQARLEHDEAIRQTHEELEELYATKVNDLQGALDRSMSVGSSSREDYLLTKRRVDELSSEITKLKAQNAGYLSRIEDLENQLRSECDMFEQRLLQKDTEIMDLRQALHDQTKEYADLLDVKLKLDIEIKAYRQLLEGEEERLNISATSSDSSTPKKGRGLKRKRVTLDVSESTSAKSGYEYESEAAAKGAIEIHDTDHEGKFIKLFNTGEEDIVLGGWILKHEAGDKETVYKFHRNLKLPAGHFVTVWSSNAGQTHSPPSDLVMKGQQWFTDEEMKTTLLHEDQEMASRVLKKTQRRVTRTYRTLRDGDDDVEGREKCSIM
ncbi:prelamin-A/C-like [Ruditapes philippinarum]|uniref:prelamin-A/C-like n=1 Tax=Ruditapes philippinarum TaxID=129788 RepID=UPI00295B79B8|nr:prelamin-A/C-like [Ruditapes philippinarum]